MQVPLTEKEEEELGVKDMPWSLRATVTPSTTDFKKSALHIGVIPVAKTQIQQAIDAWKLDIQQRDELVPILGTAVSNRGPGQEDWRDKWSIILRNLPVEVEEDKVGLGILPIFEAAPEDNLVPGRLEIAKEMTDMMAQFKGRCVWKRKDKTKLSSFFVGENGQIMKPSRKQLKDCLEKCTNNWPSLLPQEKGPTKRKGTAGAGSSKQAAPSRQEEEEEETDCWAHERLEEEEEIIDLNDDTIVEHPDERDGVSPSKRRRTGDTQAQVAGVTRLQQGPQIVMDANFLESLFERMDKRMEARMGPSQEMKDFYKNQSEAFMKVNREPTSTTKMNEDKMVLVEKTINVRDDGKTIIDIPMRMMGSKFPNSAPDTWWNAQIPQVTKPRLAHSLQFGYVTGSHVCRETVWKMHDRGEFLTLKNFSSNNSGITCKVQKKISMEDGSTGEVMGTSEKDWKDIASLAEAKGAVRNVQVLTLMIRSYDYGKEIETGIKGL